MNISCPLDYASLGFERKDLKGYAGRKATVTRRKALVLKIHRTLGEIVIDNGKT